MPTLRPSFPVTFRRGSSLVAPLLVLCACVSSAAAQQPSSPATPAPTWDVTLARGQTRDIDFTTSEGTWTSVDVSPDGQWLVFDLLGHIYRMPATGGEAVSLTQSSGVASNYHPRISPDGRTIAFVSDRRGQNNLWLMNADGSNPRPVFLDLNVRVVEPAWTPDGQFIIVRRQQLGGAGEGGGNGSGLWMYHRDGGVGVPLVTQGVTGAPRQPEWPSVSRDGRFVYFFADGLQPTVSGRNDVLQGSKQLYRLDRRTGHISEVTAGVSVQQHQGSSGGAVAPEISPDGRYLAFARRIPDGTITWKGHEFGPRTALWIRDLETGTERVLMDPIEFELSEGIKTLRVLPAYAWAPDGRSLIVPQGGKIRRVDFATGNVTTIPYTARVHRTISEIAYSPVPISDGPLEPRFLRWHTASPDGRRLAFQAVGHVWVMDLPGCGTPVANAVTQASSCRPRRVTSNDFAGVEYSPAWSPDGQWLAFTSYDDENLGQLWKVAAAGGAPVRLTQVAGEYLNPTWSPDGRTIVFVRGSGASARHRTVSNNTGYELRSISASGGASKLVIEVDRPFNAGRPMMPRRPIVEPSFGPGGRIYYPETKGLMPNAARGNASAADVAEHTELISVNLDGTDRRVHAIFPYADEMAVSPDGKWIGYQEGDNVFLVAFPGEAVGGQPPRIERKGANANRFAIRTLTRQGGLFPHWRDSTTLEFGSANHYYAYHTAAAHADTVDVHFTVPREIAHGTIALTNARIITLEQRKVIDRGTVVVTDGRITCVGSCSTNGVSRVINASGKTIVPGFIDMHAHDHREHEGLMPKKNWESAIDLAYGVTTELDPSMWSSIIFPTAEMIEAGVTRGPRTYSTGDPLYAGDNARQNDLTSYQVAEDNVLRLKSWGAVTMKQYMQPRRDQRQWISDVARKEGLRVTAEGGDLDYDMGMIMDGQTGWEHPLPYSPLYSDAAKFFGLAHATYSPTLMVGGPVQWNEEYWFQQSDVWKDKKLQHWTPWRMLIPDTRHRMLRPVTDYSFPMLAQGEADIIANGGYGSIGAHGQMHGIGEQWEIWMQASALGNMGALEVASLHAAHFLGMDHDIGSIAVGKLGDLLVLTGNPLEDIHHTNDIQYVMKAGILYDAETLDELWPEQSAYGKNFWYDADAFRADKRPVDYWDRQEAKPRAP